MIAEIRDDKHVHIYAENPTEVMALAYLTEDGDIELPILIDCSLNHLNKKEGE
jgi:hypothetical protein